MNRDELPQVGQWIVYDDRWGDPEAAVADKVTAKQVWVKRRWGSGMSHLSLDQILLTAPNEDVARKTAERLVSAEAEKNRRLQAAQAWCTKERTRIIVRVQAAEKPL